MTDEKTPRNLLVGRDNPIFQARLAFDALTVYRCLREDDFLKSLYRLIETVCLEQDELSCFIRQYCELVAFLTKKQDNGFLAEYIVRSLLSDENSFTEKAQTVAFRDLPAGLKRAAASDLELLQRLACLPAEGFKRYAAETLCHPVFP